MYLKIHHYNKNRKNQKTIPSTRLRAWLQIYAISHHILPSTKIWLYQRAGNFTFPTPGPWPGILSPRNPFGSWRKKFESWNLGDVTNDVDVFPTSIQWVKWFKEFHGCLWFWTLQLDTWIIHWWIMVDPLPHGVFGTVILSPHSVFIV